MSHRPQRIDLGLASAHDAVSVKVNYGHYDAATGVYTAQTQEQFRAGLTADIQRALDSGVLDEEPAKTIPELQEEARQASEKEAAKRAEERAAARANAKAKEERRQALMEEKKVRGAAPCWLCLQDKEEEHFHAPKRGSCPCADTGYYIFLKDGTPNCAYMRTDYREELRERRAAKKRAAEQKQAPTTQHGLAEFLDAAGALVSPAKKASKKKPTVEKFSLDEI
jgi:hypothetical protein